MTPGADTRSYALVHSPLVGPSVWEPVASELAAMDEYVLVAHLPEPSTTQLPHWRACVDAVRLEVSAAGFDRPVLVGHSGAGLLLPGIDDAARAYVFVDSEVPAPGRVAVMPQWLRENVTGLTAGDRIPPWSEWWGEGAMSTLVPDPAMRARVEADLPRLLRDYPDEEVDVPTWPEDRGAYLQLSPLFSDDADAAYARGWPVERFDAGHLHLVVEPRAVAERIVALADAVQAR
jgi:hypothetical protein